MSYAHFLVDILRRNIPCRRECNKKYQDAELLSVADALASKPQTRVSIRGVVKSVSIHMVQGLLLLRN